MLNSEEEERLKVTTNIVSLFSDPKFQTLREEIAMRRAKEEDIKLNSYDKNFDNTKLHGIMVFEHILREVYAEYVDLANNSER